MENKRIKGKLFNWGMAVWFLISFWIVWSLFGANFKAFIVSFVIYGIAIGLSISPMGEWIFRKLVRAREIATSAERNRLMPLFHAVYSASLQQMPWIGEKVKLYIVDDPMPNAAALGKNTVYVTRGLMEISTDEEIMAVLAHEFAHLGHGDTMAILVATIGNWVLAGVLLLFRLILVVMSNVLKEDYGVNANWGIKMFDWLIGAFVFLGVMAAMYSSRQCEFEADKFSVGLGHGQGLLSFMEKLVYMEGQKSSHMGIMQALTATHPKTSLRIGKIEELMAA